MSVHKITEGITRFGAQDFDRRLFDELIPLPDGTSYNAYLVEGAQKTALIDTVDPRKEDALAARLASTDRLDYLVTQHVEQDHSGSIPLVLERFPAATILTTPKAKPMIVDHLHVAEDRIRTVEDGETVSLGGRTLEFLHTPWVHWPETMLTYLREERLLFTCDFLGSHLATTELYGPGRERVYEAAKRYYAEIMMPFRTTIEGHLERLSHVDIATIAPSHGPVHDDPAFILDAYRRWVLGPPENLVILPYVSMHGSTALMVDHLIEALGQRGVRVEPFNLTVTDLGKLAITLVDAATVLFATPTLLSGPHPSVLSAAYLIAALRPKLRHAAIVASYGWAGKATKRLTDLVKTLRVEWLDPVKVKGQPRKADYEALDRLAEAITARHAALEKGG